MLDLAKYVPSKINPNARQSLVVLGRACFGTDRARQTATQRRTPSASLDKPFLIRDYSVAPNPVR